MSELVEQGKRIRNGNVTCQDSGKNINSAVRRMIVESGVGKRSKKLTELRSKTGVCKHHHYRHNFKPEKTMVIKKKFRRVGSFLCRGGYTLYTKPVTPFLFLCVAHANVLPVNSPQNTF